MLRLLPAVALAAPASAEPRGLRIVFEPPVLVDPNETAISSHPKAGDVGPPEGFWRVGGATPGATHIIGPGPTPGPPTGPTRFDFSADSGAHCTPPDPRPGACTSATSPHPPHPAVACLLQGPAGAASSPWGPTESAARTVSLLPPAAGPSARPSASPAAGQRHFTTSASPVGARPAPQPSASPPTVPSPRS